MRKLGLSLSLTSAAMAVRSAFKIANVNPVLWWDAESHRAGLAGGAATLFQDSAGATAVTAVEQPVGLVRSMANAGPRRNLLTYSEQFDNAAWVKVPTTVVVANTSNTSSPNGESNAEKIISTGSLSAVYQAVTPFVTFGNNYRVVNLDDGSFGPNLLGSFEGFSVSDAGGGWWRIAATKSSKTYSVYAKKAEYKYVGIQMYDNGSESRIYAYPLATNQIGSGGNTSSGIYLWGAQLELGSTASTYQRITSGLEYLDALQATSTARPVLTARKNLLTETETFSTYPWTSNNVVRSGGAAAPDGTNTATTLTFSGGDTGFIYYRTPVITGTAVVSLYMRAMTPTTINFGAYDSAELMTSASVTTEWQRFERVLPNGLTSNDRRVVRLYASNQNATIEVWHPQLEIGSAATSYQRITTATDYDTTAAPLMLRFDGVDDALSTGTFAAGTLPANADVYVVINRAVGDGQFLVGSDGSNYICCATPGDQQNHVHSGSGSPTNAVNGVDVPGGSLTTRGQLWSAMPEGSLLVFEARNANLSSWVKFMVSGYGFGFNLAGSIGAVLITPAQPDATRAKIRKALAKAYQITGVV